MYVYSQVGVMNDATFVSQINSPLSGPSPEPLDKETDRCEPSASETAQQRDTLGRRRLESSSTEYENVHISHYTLTRVLVYINENESRHEAISVYFFL